MENTIVRINEIELNGFKNIDHGVIQMMSANEKKYFSKKADILGIYGQNGSGKTAVIEAMEIVQTLLMGKPLLDSVINYISKESNNCTITVKFAVETPHGKDVVEYFVELNRVNNADFVIERETLSGYKWNEEKSDFDKVRELIKYSQDSTNEVFTPKYRFNDLIRCDAENKLNLNVAKKFAQKERCSFIFGDEGMQIFTSAPDNVASDYKYIIAKLRNYANMNLFVISNAHAGAISINFLIPFAFRLKMEDGIAKGDLPIRLDEPSIIDDMNYQIMMEIIAGMNIVVGTIIPGLSIKIHNYGEQLMGNGTIGYKIELLSKRGDVEIPLKYESEGIIKIISVLNVLMCVYNDPSMCLFIDELDAGIYEYLLGELLGVFEEGAKGQIIFTSHNLRALEMISKKCIIISTTNPKERYIRLQNVKSNNNLRDMYLRSILLGGQKEELYDETDSVEIGRAFRRARKVAIDGWKN